MELSALSEDAIHAYASTHMNITRELVSYICEQADGETYLIQNLLHTLYMSKKKSLDEDDVNASLRSNIEQRSSAFRLLYDNLTNPQKTALKIAVRYGENVFDAKVLAENQIKKSTLQTALKKLQESEIIDKEDGHYFVPNRVFELWVQQL